MGYSKTIFLLPVLLVLLRFVSFLAAGSCFLSVCQAALRTLFPNFHVEGFASLSRPPIVYVSADDPHTGEQLCYAMGLPRKCIRFLTGADPCVRQLVYRRGLICSVPAQYLTTPRPRLTWTCWRQRYRRTGQRAPLRSWSSHARVSVC